MEWKYFFKPTKLKISLFIILFLLLAPILNFIYPHSYKFGHYSSGSGKPSIVSPILGWPLSFFGSIQKCDSVIVGTSETEGNIWEEKCKFSEISFFSFNPISSQINWNIPYIIITFLINIVQWYFITAIMYSFLFNRKF